MSQTALLTKEYFYICSTLVFDSDVLLKDHLNNAAADKFTSESIQNALGL